MSPLQPEGKTVKKILASLAIFAAALLAAAPAFAVNPAIGYIARAEVHVGTGQIRFRVNAGSDQTICVISGTNVIEGYFPLAANTTVGSFTYTQNIIDALSSAVRLGRGSPIQVDVYAVDNGAGACAITDIVLE